MSADHHTTEAVFAAMSRARMANYLTACDGDETVALELYTWNSQVSAAFWETLGHVEVALRNAIATRLQLRHVHRRRTGSWLDDHHQELDPKARHDIRKARNRVRKKHKPVSDGQTIAELTFGFWRFLLAKQYNTGLWPDLARGFPHAPDKARHTVEHPVKRLHEFRNRLAHHEPVWDKPLAAYHQDGCDVLGYIDPAFAAWVDKNCRISDLLLSCPVTRPHP